MKNQRTKKLSVCFNECCVTRKKSKGSHFIKKNNEGTGETAPWLRVHMAVTEDSSLVPAPTSGGSQPPKLQLQGI